MPLISKTLAELPGSPGRVPLTPVHTWPLTLWFLRHPGVLTMRHQVSTILLQRDTSHVTGVFWKLGGIALLAGAPLREPGAGGRHPRARAQRGCGSDSASSLQDEAGGPGLLDLSFPLRPWGYLGSPHSSLPTLGCGIQLPPL